MKLTATRCKLRSLQHAKDEFQPKEPVDLLLL